MNDECELPTQVYNHSIVICKKKNDCGEGTDY